MPKMPKNTKNVSIKKYIIDEIKNKSYFSKILLIFSVY